MQFLDFPASVSDLPLVIRHLILQLPHSMPLKIINSSLLLSQQLILPLQLPQLLVQVSGLVLAVFFIVGDSGVVGGGGCGGPEGEFVFVGGYAGGL